MKAILIRMAFLFWTLAKDLQNGFWRIRKFGLFSNIKLSRYTLGSEHPDLYTPKTPQLRIFPNHVNDLVNNQLLSACLLI